MGLFKDWAKSHKMGDPVRGTLHVSACTAADPGATSANFNLDGVVSADGIVPTAVNHSGIAKLRKWPSPGQDLPVTVDRADPTRLRIEWDEVQTGDERGAASAARLAESMRAAGSGPAVAPGAATTPGAPLDLSALMGLAGTSGSSQVVDLRGTGAREQILAAMGDPEQLQATIMQTLADAGIQVPQAGGGATGFPQPGAVAGDQEDPATRLRRLESLRQQGLVDADEYARLRAQILQDV
jgi:hypothetical protein